MNMKNIKPVKYIWLEKEVAIIKDTSGISQLTYDGNAVTYHLTSIIDKLIEDGQLKLVEDKNGNN